MPTRRRGRGIGHLLGASGDTNTIRVPAWAISAATLSLLLVIAALSVFGVYQYLRAQRLAEQVGVASPDPRTRELQRAILDQQSRVQSLQDDYNALTRQVDERQRQLEREIERLSGQLRELDHLAAEIRALLGLPAVAPMPTPRATPGSLAPAGRGFVRFLAQGGASLSPRDLAFPPIDPDPYNLGLTLDLVRAQTALQDSRLRGLHAEVAARRASEEAAAARARAEAEAARQRAEEAARAQAEAEARLAEATARAAAEQAARRATSSDPQLAQLDRQVTSLIEKLRAGAALAPVSRQILSVPLPTSGPGAPNRWPLKAELTSAFGYRTFRDTLDWHTGIDLAVDQGTEIHPTQGGLVVFAGWQPGFGWCVEIGHGQGYSTLYGHLSRILVDAGDTATTDSVLGLSGSTGNSTGPHLHYEVRLNGKAVDPTPYLP